MSEYQKYSILTLVQLAIHKIINQKEHKFYRPSNMLIFGKKRESI